MEKIPIYHVRRVRRDTRAVESLGFFGKLESARAETARVSRVASLASPGVWSKRLDNRQTAATKTYVYVLDRNWLRDPDTMTWGKSKGKKSLDKRSKT